MVLESSAIQFKQHVDDNEIFDWDDVFIRFPLNRTKYSVYPGANIAYVEDGGKLQEDIALQDIKQNITIRLALLQQDME